jgi:prolyl-tRNA editing enzyme YbaK/EbsC (Cys-tRNA(Pro) deacylase)
MLGARAAGPVIEVTPGSYPSPGGRGPKRSCRLAAVPDTPLPLPIQRVVDAAARKGVTLEIRVFGESTHTAEEAAAAVGAELGQIVKSLVFVAPGPDESPQPILCLVSGPNRVDLARLAAVSGERDVRRATAVEARELTGFTIGGIPPIGHGRAMRVIMDPDLGRFQVVWAAAGTPTAVFPVPPGTLRMLSNAHVAPICEERRQADELARRAGLPGTPVDPSSAGT